MFCAVSKQSGVLECHLCHISKNENYELCISAGFFVMTGKKKVLVVCLAGALSLLRPEKKRVLVVCLAGARTLLQPEKKF